MTLGIPQLYFENCKTMTPETILFLKEITARSEKDFEEGKTYSHEQVKEMLKTRIWKNLKT